MTGLLMAAAAGAALLTLAAAVLVLVTAWLRRRLVVIDVDGASMEPTLRDGDRVLVRRAALDRVRPGDLVVLADESYPRRRCGAVAAARTGQGLSSQRWLIKRAVAVPGDPVPVAVAAAAGVPAGTPVPGGRLVVLGDNPDRSYDSRDRGYFGGEELLGVVLRPMR